MSIMFKMDDKITVILRVNPPPPPHSESHSSLLPPIMCKTPQLFNYHVDIGCVQFVDISQDPMQASQHCTYQAAMEDGWPSNYLWKTRKLAAVQREVCLLSAREDLV